MHIDISKRNGPKGQTYTRALLRESFREDGRVRKRTIANLSKCDPSEVEAIRIALKHKGDLKRLIEQNLAVQTETQQGLSVGAVVLIGQLARRLHLQECLGSSRQAKLVLWLVMAQLIAPGSRLHAVRLAKQHAGCEVLGLGGFNEDDLYAALDWAAERQSCVEDRLFKKRYDTSPPNLYLYDVTSSYLEGQENELATYGYNRDKKKGKKQIVIGLLTDGDGYPLTIQAFEGNTQDPQTVLDQIRKMTDRFHVRKATLVGDRGMIKQCQIDDLNARGFHYITGITKPQIETLIRQGRIQYELFGETLCEVEIDGLRYLLRRNPIRAEEMAANRESKFETIRATAVTENAYLAEHPGARPGIALRKVVHKAEHLNVATLLQIELEGRDISVTVNEAAHASTVRLDGCYVLKTDLRPEDASATEVHQRYRDLAHVEHAFRTMKQDFLNVRPLYLRNECRTRGHLFVVMLAYLISRELRSLWISLDCTVEEGLQELSCLASISLTIGDQQLESIPTPRPLSAALLTAAGIQLPTVLPSRRVLVDTRKNLADSR